MSADAVTAPGTVGPSMPEQGRELQQALTGYGVTVKLVGGVAVALRCPGMPGYGLARDYHDIDICARARDVKALEAAMAALGLEPHQHFNAMNYGRQMMFSNPATGMHVDVFLDVLRMCQELRFADRLAVDAHPSLPVSDLALSKLQIVELTVKDETDLLALLLDHKPAHGDEAGLNITRITDTCRASWGWWQSSMITLDACQAHAAACLPAAAQAEASARIETLRAALISAPKTARWKTRARIGSRIPWYELPEATQTS
jgi:hypothetical protein